MGEPALFGGGVVLVITKEVGAMAIALPRHRFTVAEYETMAKVGILAEDARVE